jgi:nitrite reductase/ring-hydroxylating ferredoxin subunit
VSDRSAPSGSPPLSRRRFLVRGLGLGAGLVAAPSAASLAACQPPTPSAPPPANVWAPVRVAALEPYVPRWVEFPLVDLPLESSDGSGAPDRPPAEPVESPGDGVAAGTGGAWLVRGSDGTVTAYAPWCTHLLCLYGWESAEGFFRCRCHDGRYNLSGIPVSGPPPRPLWPLETRPTTDPGVIEIGWYRAP